MASQSQSAVPEHVCIVMDGNGRWAKKRLMPRSFGHRKGVETTRSVVEYFARAGVRYLTLFAFSSENWQRPAEEVGSLMELFMQSLRRYTGELNEKQIRIRFIGDMSQFSHALREQIRLSEQETAGNDGMIVNVAANYGGRADIVDACRKLALRVARGELDAADIDPERFGAELSIADCPDPDLFIRTGGEKRISNFLLWQCAYTEFYFCDSLWPEFAEPKMQAALDEYARRQRRFGRTGEQVEVDAEC